MTKQPLVSIITPVYNHEKFIGKTIESVLSQTYKNWELLIVDDCSTDKSWEIIQEYAKKDSRIKAFRNTENKGLIPNWKFLIDNSKGEYIAFLEGDDLFLKDNLSKKIEAFQNFPEVRMVYSDVSVVNESGAVIYKSHYRKYNIKTYSVEKIKPADYLMSSISPFVTYSQVMIRREILTTIGFPRSLDRHSKIFLPSDWDYNFRISTNSRVYFVDEVLLKYRKHMTNNSSDTPRSVEHFNLLFKDYERFFGGDSQVLEGILYQRGKMKYAMSLFFLERNEKQKAWAMFIEYVSQYPRNILYDFSLSLKLFFRLLLPKRINSLIIQKYYKR